MSSLKEITDQYDSAKSRLREYGIDLDSFVNDSAVRRKLLLDLKPLGIDFRRIHRVGETTVIKRDRIINLGQKEITNFPAHDMGGRMHEEKIRVSVIPEKEKADPSVDFLDVSAGVKIIDYMILPLVNADPLEPSVSVDFHRTHAEDLPPGPPGLTPPGLTSLDAVRIVEEGNANNSPGIDEILLSVRLPEEFRGECRYWVLVVMQAQETIKGLPFVGKRANANVFIITALKFVCNIVGEGMMSVLSTEARSFVPKSIKALFDISYPMVNIVKYEDFIPGAIFEILHRLGNLGLANRQVPTKWYQTFMAYKKGSEQKKSALQQFVAHNERKDKYSKFLLHLDLESLHQEEEMKEHDLVELSLYGAFHNVEMMQPLEEGPLKMQCSFIWRGSKEGRPLIQKNSILQLRPTRASMAKLEQSLKVLRPNSASLASAPPGNAPPPIFNSDVTGEYSPFLDNFFLSIVVTDFNLSQERVIGYIQFRYLLLGPIEAFSIFERMASQKFINELILPSKETLDLAKTKSAPDRPQELVFNDGTGLKRFDREQLTKDCIKKMHNRTRVDNIDRALQIMMMLEDLTWHCRAGVDKTDYIFAKHACVMLQRDPYLQSVLEPGESPHTHTGQTLCFDTAEEHLYHRAASIGNAANCEKLMLDLNSEQKEAVIHIAAFRSHIGCMVDLSSQTHCRPPPYIIFGPPGTGKTRTIISSIEMIARTSTEFKVLTVAPSDAAADVLCTRLRDCMIVKYNQEAMGFKGGRNDNRVVLIRVNTHYRAENSVPTALRRFCYVEGGEVMQFFEADADASYSAPDLKDLFTQYPRVIIVSTPTGSGGMWDPSSWPSPHPGHYHASSPPGFDYIFIDESSQAMEPELLTPLTLLSKDKYSMVILAGDPKQLVGDSKNELSKSFMDCDSLMERLLKTEPYSNFNHPYSSNSEKASDDGRIRMGVFLTKNYRSHADILKLPSKLFYEDKLEECADKTITESIVGDGSNDYAPRWILKESSIMSRDFVGSGKSAVNFVNVTTTHAHQFGSPSFYNEGEIDAIVKVIQACIDGTRNELIDPPLKITDFGVICATRAQVLMVRDRLRGIEHQGMNLRGVNVGSVEDMQGQEVRVVIISTVLSSRPQMLNVDNDASGGRSPMGLLAHANKFNVAITRGKSLCVVVGNANLLLTDTYWRQYIQLCSSLKGYWGHKAPLFDRGDLKEDSSPAINNTNDNEETIEDNIFSQFLLRDLLEDESGLTGNVEKEGDIILYKGRATNGSSR